MIQVPLSEQHQMFDLLIRSGADTTTPDKFGCTPLTAVLDMCRLYQWDDRQLADQPRDYFIWRLLQEAPGGASINGLMPYSWSSREGYSPLHAFVVSCGGFSAFEREDGLQFVNNNINLLLDAGADVAAGVMSGVKEFASSTLLIEACEAAVAPGVLLHLISKGADIHGRRQSARLVSGCTALHSAARKSHEVVVEALIAAGADVNAVDDLGWSPMMEAVKVQNLQVVRTLIQAGARADAATNSGSTPLSHACKFCRSASAPERAMEIVHALLDAGASPFWKIVPENEHATGIKLAGILNDCSPFMIACGSHDNADLLRINHGPMCGSAFGRSICRRPPRRPCEQQHEHHRSGMEPRTDPRVRR